MKVICAGCIAAALWAQAPVRSPEVAPDRRVTFRLLAPNAGQVSLTGEFMRGTKALEKNEQGLWSVTIGPLDPEIYNYIFTIDGVKTIDPNNANVKTGSTPGTIASILEISGGQPAFYDAQAVPHGEIRTHWYESKSLHTTRRLTVYTPPGYDRDARTRYPVLYLFHGANADETAWTRLGHVNLILDNLLASGKSKPFVVAMPFGYGVPPGGGGGGNTAAFARDLLEDVLPFVGAHYRVYADRDHRAIAGLSMGGEESLEIGMGHPELFGYVGGFSAAIGNASLQQNFAGLTGGRKLHLLWIGCGKDDSLFAASENFSKSLDAAHIVHTFRQSEGAHTWMVWRRYLNEFAPLLF
jgi:enterochelin esterase family protein